MQPSQSFLTDARTFMPLICICCWSRVEAPNIRGTVRRVLRVLGTDENERAIAVAGEEKAVSRSRLARREAMNMAAAVMRWGWG